MIKKQTKIAKTLFKKSLDAKGQLAPSRVRQTLAAVARTRPQGALGILKIYRRLVAQKLKKEEVEIEAAQSLRSKKFEKLILEKTDARRINFKANPNLVLGAKITHGDWIWDATLDAKLEQITSSK